ncbi:MAG: MerR family transcriptional regulator [Acetatifactor sp.]
MEEKMYTAGEIAKLAGVSLKTIRFYDAKGLLKPVAHSEAGYRFYNRNSVVELQKILMLKYLGFSLQQIEGLTKGESEMSFDEQLYRQKELLVQRKNQLEELIETIEIMEKSGETRRWDYLLRLLSLLTDEEKVKQQYETSVNLERRINLHSYSTANQGWMEWVYERLPLKAGDKILEIGCGTGLLWKENLFSLPDKLELTLTDRSEGMLEQTRGGDFGIIR